MNESQKKISTTVPDKDELSGFVADYLSCKQDYAEALNFGTVFHGHVYAKLCIDLLKKCQITPDTITSIARFYMAYESDPVAALILIDRKMKIKDIVKFSEGYRPKMSDFTNEITELCAEAKVKKCVVLYNFRCRDSEYRELYDINKLYDDLAGMEINLVDTLRITDGNAISIILPYNKNGYKK